jgi:hypothetical protein
MTTYVTGPTTSSFDAVARISHEGEVEVFTADWAVPGMASMRAAFT